MKQTLTILAVLIALAVGSASAAPISGQLNITGSIRIFPGSADFFPLGPGGDFNVEPTTTIAGLEIPGDQDDGDFDPVDPGISVPLSTPVSVPDFLTFHALNTISFELTRVEAGINPPCPALPACSSGPFNLRENPFSTEANFFLSGNVYSNNVLVSTFSGSFTNTFNRQTIAGLLGQIAANGFIDSGFTANLTITAIPEPSTGLLFGIGAALVVSRFYLRRKRIQ